MSLSTLQNLLFHELRRLPRPCQFCTMYLPLPKFWSQFEPIFVFISLLLLL